MTAYVPPYGPSVPEWQRQVALAINPALQRLDAISPSLRDFGVAGDGQTDDTAAFQVAVDTIGDLGGGVIDCSTCPTIKVSSTIRIGNGTTSLPSARNNIFLRGSGGNSAFVATDPGTTVIWAGAPGGTVLQFDGAMSGGGLLESWTIDGNGVAATGLDVCHLEGGRFGTIKVQKCTGVYTKLRTQTNPDTVGGCRNNIFDVYKTDTLPSGSIGLALDGLTTLAADVLQNHFRVVDIPISGAGATGIYLGYADFNSFDIVDIGEQSTVTTSVGVMLAGGGPAGDTLFPCMNRFGLLAAGAPLATDTTHGQPYGNFIEQYDLADSYNHAVPTAVGYYGYALVSDLTGAQRRQLSFGFKGDGFNTATPSLPALNTDVQNANPYPVGVYMSPSSGSVVSGITMTDEHGTVSAIPVAIYVRLAPNAKIKFTSAVPGFWLWYGEI